MNTTFFTQRSWWRRLARRSRTTAPRSNRLSHFEPLEPRTVLSGVWMGDGDFWHGPQHDVYPFDAAAGVGEYAAGNSHGSDQQFFVGPKFERISEEGFEYRDSTYGPHDFGEGPTVAGPQHDFAIEWQSTIESNVPTGEGEASLSMPSLAGPTLPAFTASE